MKHIKSINVKKALLGLSLFVLVFLSDSFTLKKKECNPEPLRSEGMGKLKEYTLLKEYPFNFREKKKDKPIEYKKQMVALNRGVKYKFMAISNKEFEGRGVVSIFNNEKHESLLATTYNPTFKKFYDELTFECKTTGNYCLSFSFHEGMEGCAVGLMAFLETAQ